jgi:hypothetical protein
VDAGGPATYDPSPTSKTTSIWEPSLNIDANGDLATYLSDERQKVYDGSDRPGMITVVKLGSGQYMATYEVVNQPSQSLNTAVVCAKFSSDGVTWTANSLGTKIALANGRGPGSSPFVRWVPAGGPNGSVVVSSKWALDGSGNISGGQNDVRVGTVPLNTHHYEAERATLNDSRPPRRAPRTR